MRFATVALAGAAAVSGLSLPRMRGPELVGDFFGKADTLTIDEIKQALSIDPDNVEPEDDDEPFEPATKSNFALPGSMSANKGGSNGSAPEPASQCTNPNIRFEWRHYSNSDRHALVDAMDCLMTRPPSGKFSPATNRYEDFVRLHQLYTPNIHGNDKFLIWHRYFTWAFEQALREECGFDRAFVFWDETLDAGNFGNSSLFTPEFFGTLEPAQEGKSSCVKDGKFADNTLHIGPKDANEPHCLARDLDETMTAQCSKEFENYCLSQTTFHAFARCWERGPHGFGHNAFGRVMADVQASPGEPAFWMHHLYIDRVFRVWQNMDPKRGVKISGCADTQSPCTPLTLDTMVYMGGLVPDAPVRDILNTMSGKYCYRYEY